MNVVGTFSDIKNSYFGIFNDVISSEIGAFNLPTKSKLILFTQQTIIFWSRWGEIFIHLRQLFTGKMNINLSMLIL